MEFKLLVVDDEPEITQTLSELFQEHGFRVLQAGSGDEAIALLNQKPVDLVFLDLNMPGISGIEVLRHAKAKTPHTKVVVVTGYPEREQEARQNGCDGFVRKPIVTKELVDLVHALLVRKDEDELKSITLGPKMLEAFPGEPLALLLLFEPSETIARLLLRFLGSVQDSKGVYKVELVTDAEQAEAVLIGIHPDIVLMDMASVDEPGRAARKLLACSVQPQDYIFYKPPQAPHKEPLPSLPGKRWEGNPWEMEDLRVLAELVRKIALEHNLIKR